MRIGPDNPFKGRQHPGEVILLCVRLYLRYSVVRAHRRTGGRTGRGRRRELHLALGAGLCTGAEQTLSFLSEASQQELSHRRTCIKVKGEDKYLYRALDSTGQTIDFLLTAKRDMAAAKRFLRRAIDASGDAMPRVMNVDKNPAYPAALEALKAKVPFPGGLLYVNASI
jgi:transposase, IS6 family